MTSSNAMNQSGNFSLEYEPAFVPKHVHQPYKRPPKEQEITYGEKQRARSAGLEIGERVFPEAAAGIHEDEKWFRHHNWSAKRDAVLVALTEAGTSTQTLFNFSNCGAEATVEWSETLQRYRVRGSYCHNRHCEPCMKAKSSLIINNLRAQMKSRPKVQTRFVTLTLCHTGKPLRDEIKRLYAAWKQLRGKKQWKKSQDGGTATLEVKYNAEKKEWHPHLHIISEGRYLSSKTLSDLWLECTGDSYIVDVRFISSDKDVAYYVGKYVTKGVNLEVWQDQAAAIEWIKAIKGVRMCATFGNWRGFKLLEKPKDEGNWQPVASLLTLVKRAAAGSIADLELLRILTESLQYNPHKPRTRRTPEPDLRL